MQTSSRSSIEAHFEWCASKGKGLFSPVSNEPMGLALLPNVIVRQLIVDYVQEKQELLNQKTGGGKV